MKFIKVLIPAQKMFLLDYLAEENLRLEVGDLVIVPFRNKEVQAIVWEILTGSKVSKLKSIKEKVQVDFKFNIEELKFIEKTSEYYLAELGSIARLALPVDITALPMKIKKQQLPNEFNLPELSIEQQNALKLIKQSNKPVVVKGVTGSGKTEVYFHLINEYLRQGKQVLILLPEISLSTQIIKRFIGRFNVEPVVWNSTVSIAQKKMILRGIMTGEVKVVIGARSALFLPYRSLGAIVVDEEHDTSYKQEDSTLYHARDMAVLRGHLSQVKVLLCSATPSIETLYNAREGKYELIELRSRFQKAVMPEIKVVDMRKQNLPQNMWVSETLKEAIKDNLESGGQTLLFLNRRGYSPLILCKTCGYRFTCSFCSAWLVMHKSSAKLECHHCGHSSKIPKSCPDCQKNDTLCPCGPGVERIYEEIKVLFPNTTIEMASKDHSSKPNEMHELFSRMEAGKVDILIGTQMITKGHHFPDLTLVGVIDADLGLFSSDLRSTERTYQLLHQVAGRAGREQKKGVVLLQTYFPDNPVIKALQNYEEEDLINTEMENRKAARMPPYTKMASIIFTGKNERKTMDFARFFVSLAPRSEASILGPAQAMMSKLSGKYRYRALVVAHRQFNMQRYLRVWIDEVKIPSHISIKVDIDPQSFY